MLRFCDLPYLIFGPFTGYLLLVDLNFALMQVLRTRVLSFYALIVQVLRTRVLSFYTLIVQVLRTRVLP